MKFTHYFQKWQCTYMNVSNSSTLLVTNSSELDNWYVLLNVFHIHFVSSDRHRRCSQCLGQRKASETS